MLASPRMSEAVLQVSDDARALTELAVEWRALFARAGGSNVFLSWEWVSGWWASFGHGRELHLVSQRAGHRIVGVAALMIDTDTAGARRLRAIGCTRTTDYWDVLVDPAHAATFVTALAHWLERGFPRDWQSVSLGPCRQGAASVLSLGDTLRRHGLAAREQRVDTCPRLEIPRRDEPGWLDLERSMLRKMVRAASQRAVTFRRTSGGSAALAADLDAYFRLHRLSRPEKTLFLDAEMRQFVEHVATAFHHAGWLRLEFLEISGHAVAATLSFCRDGAALFYNSGRDPGVVGNGLGLGLLAFGVLGAMREGLRHFDFLRGNEAYKYRFGARDHDLVELYIGPFP
jgi:CelD/BcsL family acetyltransferase involved in cellulose biosynthesis